MRLQGPAARLTIMIDGNDQWHHRPLYAEIIHRAHRDGLAGATALCGVEGFAGQSDIHTGDRLTTGRHLPIMIVIIDDHTRIHTFLYSLDDLLPKGVVLLDDVEVIRYNRQPHRHFRWRRDTPPPDH